MKCRKCEAVIPDDAIRCPKCGGLIPRTQKPSKPEPGKTGKFDISLIEIGDNREELVNLLRRIPGFKDRKIEKDLEDLPLYLFRGISSERIPRIKERFEEIGALIRIQESKETEEKKEVEKSFWAKNKLLIEIGATVFSVLAVIIVILSLSSKKYVPKIYESSRGFRSSQSSSRPGKTGSFSYRTKDNREVGLNYSILSEDIVDSKTEARVETKLEVDEGVSDDAAGFMIKKIGEELKKKRGFKYFDSPTEVEVLLYNKGDEQKFGKNGWRFKYKSKKSSLGELIAQNIKKINSYPYTAFNNRRVAYYLDNKLYNNEISPEIKLYPSEHNHNAVQIGISEKNPKISKKDYLSKIASNIGSVLKDEDTKCEGIFINLPSGSYFISSELCKLAYAKWGDDFKNKELVDFIWRNIQKDEKK